MSARFLYTFLLYNVDSIRTAILICNVNSALELCNRRRIPTGSLGCIAEIKMNDLLFELTRIQYSIC